MGFSKLRREQVGRRRKLPGEKDAEARKDHGQLSPEKLATGFKPSPQPGMGREAEASEFPDFKQGHLTELQRTMQPGASAATSLCEPGHFTFLNLPPCKIGITLVIAFGRLRGSNEKMHAKHLAYSMCSKNNHCL